MFVSKGGEQYTCPKVCYKLQGTAWNVRGIDTWLYVQWNDSRLWTDWCLLNVNWANNGKFSNWLYARSWWQVQWLIAADLSWLNLASLKWNWANDVVTDGKICHINPEFLKVGRHPDNSRLCQHTQDGAHRSKPATWRNIDICICGGSQCLYSFSFEHAVIKMWLLLRVLRFKMPQQSYLETCVKKCSEML